MVYWGRKISNLIKKKNRNDNTSRISFFNCGTLRYNSLAQSLEGLKQCNIKYVRFRKYLK